MLKNKLKYFIFFLILLSNAFSNNLDSLKLLLNKSVTDTGKISTLMLISENCEIDDSSLFYAEKALQLAEQTKNIEKIAQINFLFGDIYSKLEFTEKAIKYYTNSENYFKTTKNYSKLALLYQQRGIAYEQISDFNNAGKDYLKALKLIEKQSDKIQLARILNYIGSVYYKQKQNDGALKYWNRALQIVEKLDYKRGIISILSNIGNVYLNKYNKDDTLSYHYLNESEQNFNKALLICEQIEDSVLIYHSYNNIGNLFMTKAESKKDIQINDYNKSLLYYKKALLIAQKNGDLENETISLINIANIFAKQKKYEKAIETLQVAKNNAIENDLKPLLLEVFENTSFVYKELKDYKNAYLYSSNYDSLKNIIYDENIANAYAENEKKYNYEKREKENEKLKIANQLQEEKNTKQRFFLIASIIGFVLISFLALLILKSYRQKRKANKELTELNNEINQQKDEIEAQRDLVSVQKSELETIHGEVTHSIEYAKRIQSSTLPKIEILENVFAETFILFKPRDIVSGDFYWFVKMEDVSVITIADCTGHGVPGAFMSMLGMSFLKEIVVKEFITHPGVILRKLRKEIINALQQTGQTGEQKDGMDMSLIAYNHKTKILQFAGANNPIYIISQNELNILSDKSKMLIKTEEIPTLNKKLYEIKPDKMPIAIYVKMDKFATHEIQLSDGDLIYMFSDGYADQFGGENGKKFMYKTFKRLLLNNSDKKLEVQKNELNTTIENWKAYKDENNESFPQVDDICVMGLKVWQKI